MHHLLPEALSFLLIGFFLWRLSCHLKIVSLIESTAVSKIRSAPQGYVEIEGASKVMDGPPIISPVSNVSCVWYRYKVEERQGRNWAVTAEGVSSDVFLLEDETGKIAIDPDGAKVTCKHCAHWTDTRPGSWDSMLTLFQENQRRYTEERIYTGEKIYALGALKNIGDLAPVDLDEEIDSVLHEWKQNQVKLKQRFDLNNDGEIDAQEWMLARAQARREALKAQRESLPQLSEAINLMKSGNDGRPYILSAYSKKETLARHRLRALLYAALSIAVLGYWIGLVWG